MQTFGEYLRQLRTDRRVTMARLSGRAGIAERSLRNWEQGRHEPGRVELTALLRALAAGPEEQARLEALLRAPRFHRARGPEDDAAESVPSRPTLGELIRALRRRRGLTRSQVVQRLGVRPSTLTRWEQGASLPSEENVERLADLLGALPEERAVLRRRRLQPGETAFLSLEELGERVRQLRPVLAAPREPLGDLSALSLLAALWPGARGGGEARALLGCVAAQYGAYLAYLLRLEEARRYNRLAISLLPPAPEQGMDPLPYTQMIFTHLTALNPTGEPALFPDTIVCLQRWLPRLRHPALHCYAQALAGQYASRLGRHTEAERRLDDAEQAYRRIPEGTEEWETKGPFLASVRWQAAVLASGYRREWDRMPPLTPSTHFSSAARIHLTAARMHRDGGSRQEAREHLEAAYRLIDGHRFESARSEADALAARL